MSNRASPALERINGSVLIGYSARVSEDLSEDLSATEVITIVLSL